MEGEKLICVTLVDVVKHQNPRKNRRLKRNKNTSVNEFYQLVHVLSYAIKNGLLIENYVIITLSIWKYLLARVRVLSAFLPSFPMAMPLS